jgi:hypothetical protein
MSRKGKRTGNSYFQNTAVTSSPAEIQLPVKLIIFPPNLVGREREIPITKSGF